MLKACLAWRMLARDWRAGELTVLGLALVLAVTALTSVAFLVDRVEQGLNLQARQLLGGDLLLSADHPWHDDFRGKAVELGLNYAESATFPSMVMGEGGLSLAEVKAVSANFPLRGRLRVATAVSGVDAEAPSGPAPGEAWSDERLATALATPTGGFLMLGETRLKAGPVLTLEPDRGINAFALAPRLLINFDDLPATGLIQPGSRVSWRLHLAGADGTVAAYKSWAEKQLRRGERLEDLDNARPEIRNLLERAQRFLRLAALLAVVLAAVAVGLAADRYMRRHLDGCAVMRCIGASERQILAIHGGEFVFFGLLATLVGALLGFLVQSGLHALLGELLAAGLPLPSWRPWALGLAVGAVLVGGFVAPPLLRLKRVPTMRVLRREWGATEPLSVSTYGLGLILLAALMLALAGELRLGGIVLGGFLAAIALFALAARLGLAVLTRVRPGSGWRHGLAGLRRRRGATVLQAVALGLGLMALLLLTVARQDLLASWRSRVPPDAPNRFIINIQTDQVGPVMEFFVRQGLQPPLMEPMVRGRLTAINGRPVSPASFGDERAQRLVEREFNLSTSSLMPKGNSVMAGRWHGNAKTPQFSVEQGLAETLGLKLGDELTYEVAGARLAAPITSLRKLEWDSMRVNFFVISSPGALEGFPTSHVTSFHLPRERQDFVGELVRAYPNLTVIDVASIVRQLQDTLDQVAKAIQAVFGFALLAGLLVLAAALQASADERVRELAVMRALGARRRQLRIALAAEFAALGALAGGLAGVGAMAVAWALAHFALHLPYLPSPLLPGLGLVCGSLGVMAAGLWATRSALGRPAMDVLREA